MRHLACVGAEFGRNQNILALPQSPIIHGMPPLVEVRDLIKRYGSLDALAGVSFDIEAGELFGLLGPNGAGKSTLIAIMSGLATATTGSVRLLGGAPQDNREAIGLAPQELALYPDLSARENLTFFGKLYGLSGPSLAERVDSVLATIGLSDRAYDRAGTYSGGMQRRLNLGAAIIHKPRIVFLDEPTVGVDPQSRAHIFDEVRRLNAAGTTVVYTSHYMEEVQALCRRVGILDHGKLVACDTVAGLLQTLGGTIVLRLEQSTPAIRARLAALPGVQMTETPADWSLRCEDVQATVPRVLAAARELDATITKLDIQEPNLERVFLHLTGRELRD
jgi:ABC-2 type transport system ATP-binding protein